MGFLDCFGGFVGGRILGWNNRRAPCRAWGWQYLVLMPGHFDDSPGGLNTHTFSIIISDCSLANNFIHLFLVDSYFVNLFLEGIWMGSMCFGVPGTLPGAYLGDFGCDARTGDRMLLKHTH